MGDAVEESCEAWLLPYKAPGACVALAYSTMAAAEDGRVASSTWLNASHGQ